MGIASSRSVTSDAQDARLRLSAQAEEDEIVPGEDGVDELRQHAVLVSDDALEERPVARETLEEIFAQLVLYAALGPRGVRRALELA